eukprot:Gb_30037 [translate_table: standard]
MGIRTVNGWRQRCGVGGKHGVCLETRDVWNRFIGCGFETCSARATAAKRLYSGEGRIGYGRICGRTQMLRKPGQCRIRGTKRR